MTFMMWFLHDVRGTIGAKYYDITVLQLKRFFDVAQKCISVETATALLQCFLRPENESCD